MDLQEWELIPDEGFLEINDDGGNNFFSRNYPSEATDFQMNYFICPPKERLLNNHFLPLPIHLQTKPQDEVVLVDEKEAIKIIPVESTESDTMMMMMPTEAKASESDKMKPLFSRGVLGGDQDPAVSQVFFFKKMKETEFVDMKVESPTSSSSSSSRGLIPQIEGGGIFQFEEKGDDSQGGGKLVLVEEVEQEMVMMEESDEGGINIWKWSLSGIGAICSFGVAVCIIILSSTHQRNNKYGDHGKQVVEVASKKINEAIRAVRGVPMSRARITYGGYYDAPSVSAASV
ncbi:hypothetical protein Salat_0982700 [Sesamum alatum]|uniref:DUF6821 domain-containing protein n=1 Tax=Sesamum alatum TaxID=300844 RepID=A0AAE1YL14_9LAMI|nr:hypothetical protein Salat_0982700 [Sesamum alatum]